MGIILGGVSPQDLIMDGNSVSLWVGGNPPVKVWPTVVQITLGPGYEAQTQFRAALADYGLDFQSVTEIPFDIELVGSGATAGMFWGCESLTTAPEMDTSNVTDMQYMFWNCSSLTHVPEVDTSQVTRMDGMFGHCSSLTNVPDLYTAKVTNMDYLFYGCESLTDGNALLMGRHPYVTTADMITDSGLTREPFDVVQITLGTGYAARDQFRAALSDRDLYHRTVTEIPFEIEFVGSGSAEYMFSECWALTHAPVMDTSSVTNMRGMFIHCSSLTYAPEMDTRQVTNMSSMFYSCSSLTWVPDMYTAKVTDVNNMFNGCASLTDGYVILYGKHPSVNTSNMIVSSGLTEQPFYPEVVQIPKATDNSTVARDAFRDALTARGLDYKTITYLPFEIELTGSGNSVFDLFAGCAALESVPSLYLPGVTNTRGMFNHCTSLTSVGDLYTYEVTNAMYMFWNCPSLTDGNVRLIGKHPNVDTSVMISGSGLTREPWYDWDGSLLIGVHQVTLTNVNGTWTEHPLVTVTVPAAETWKVRIQGTMTDASEFTNSQPFFRIGDKDSGWQGVGAVDFSGTVSYMKNTIALVTSGAARASFTGTVTITK